MKRARLRRHRDCHPSKDFISSWPRHSLLLAFRCREVPATMVRLAEDDSHVTRRGRANIPASRCDSMGAGGEDSLAHLAIGQEGLDKCANVVVAGRREAKEPTR
jgi:hypothetical protein